ncbi:hypothetical protein ABZ863_26305 [Saccharomonospora sp. NPDC046836]|uniref:hypothetical protein n=1 Tax=Saccharomonospora sp. NPDC046836 TaxID=3156921 RepID=UPI0033CF49C9
MRTCVTTRLGLGFLVLLAYFVCHSVPGLGDYDATADHSITASQELVQSANDCDPDPCHSPPEHAHCVAVPRSNDDTAITSGVQPSVGPEGFDTVGGQWPATAIRLCPDAPVPDSGRDLLHALCVLRT